jgi:hypothetical protein
VGNTNIRITLVTLDQHSLIPRASRNSLEVHVGSNALIVDPKLKLKAEKPSRILYHEVLMFKVKAFNIWGSLKLMVKSG